MQYKSHLLFQYLKLSWVNSFLDVLSHQISSGIQMLMRLSRHGTGELTVSDSKKTLAQEIIDSYKGNPIATTVVFILLPILLVLSAIRTILIYNKKIANSLFSRYDNGLKAIGVILLKMRKFDRKK